MVSGCCFYGVLGLAQGGFIRVRRGGRVLARMASISVFMATYFSKAIRGWNWIAALRSQ